jgi:hypothetical protein
MITKFSKREKFIQLFRKNNEEEPNSTFIPWQQIDEISSNCPIHVGVKLEKIGDNEYFCPKGRERYKSHGSVKNQTNKDNYHDNFSTYK